MFSQELKLKSRLSRVTSYAQLRLAIYDLLPDTDCIRLRNPYLKIFTFRDYSESHNFVFALMFSSSASTFTPSLTGSSSILQFFFSPPKLSLTEKSIILTPS